MTAFIERMVQKIAEAAPIETAMSGLVAGVIENTTSKLERLRPELALLDKDDIHADGEAA